MSKHGESIVELLSLSSTLHEVSDTPRLDVEVLLCHVLKKPRSHLYTWPDTRLAPVISQEFQALLLRRQGGEPVAHLVGTKEFWSLELEVNASTLIPRPETELLVETALQVMDKPEANVLDLGTGTGAIALALASERSGWQILAVDVVANALALAEKNRQRLGVNNVTVSKSDWFSDLGGMTFDLILANPPYIAPDDVHLYQGDVRFEPRSALVADDQGHEALQTIIAEAGQYLCSGGWLLLEHGFQQAAAVRGLLESAGFSEMSTRADINQQPRVTLGSYG